MTGRDQLLLDQEMVVAKLNRTMIGWANYFCLGPVSKAYRPLFQTAALVLLTAATRARVIPVDLAVPVRKHNVRTLPSETREDKSPKERSMPSKSMLCGFSGKGDALCSKNSSSARFIWLCIVAAPTPKKGADSSPARGRKGVAWVGSSASTSCCWKLPSNSI
jgi:hypothetical protein